MTDSIVTTIHYVLPPLQANGNETKMHQHQTARSILAKAPTTNGHTANSSIATTAYRCNICSRTFTQGFNLDKHMLAHSSRPFVCDQCGKAFAKKATRDVHLARHRGEKKKKFACYLCSKSFVTNQELSAHTLKQHTRNRLYQCHHCDLTFSRPIILSEHLKKHKKEEEEQFRCGPCERSFISYKVLAVHWLAHLYEAV